jgi:exodeoxyribonuclease VII large subunit
VQVYAVHEITTYLRELFDSDPLLGDIWVAGEVSNVNRPASGHVYFTLKDGDSQLRAAFFANRRGPGSASASNVEQGHAVVAHGRISLYESRGDLQFYVDFVQPEGVGMLQMEFERLKARLSEAGLFDESRKRPLPRFPRTIGVVTSPTGAVFHDICHVLARRWPIAEVVLAPAAVQGPEAVQALIGGVERLDRRGDIDVMIVGRGGGSLEELLAFNSEPLARAIFASTTPVVSAVGHETDTTISDLVADRRAPTPSAAAEIVAPDRRDVAIRLAIAAGSMDAAVRGRLDDERATMQQRIVSMERCAPDLDRDRQRVDDLARRAQSSIEHTQRESVQGVGACVWRLRALDPFATLERGYAIVQRGTRIISSAGAARAGEKLAVRVRDGAFGVRVEGGTKSRQQGPRRRVSPAQAPLFTMPEERV